MDGGGDPIRDKPVCVVPVSAASALAWLKGELKDLDLLTGAALVPEAVFIVNLPDRAAYGEMLRQVRYWRKRGAVFLIARTGSPVVDLHMVEKNDCIRTFQEATGQWRIICPPDQFAAWVSKWGGREHKIEPSRKPGKAIYVSGPGADLAGASKDSGAVVSRSADQPREPQHREDQPGATGPVQKGE